MEDILELATEKIDGVNDQLLELIEAMEMEPIVEDTVDIAEYEVFC